MNCVLSEVARILTETDWAVKIQPFQYDWWEPGANYHIRRNNLNANKVLCNLLVATRIFLISFDGHNYGKGEKSYEGVNFCCYEIFVQLFFIHQKTLTLDQRGFVLEPTPENKTCATLFELEILAFPSWLASELFNDGGAVSSNMECFCYFL